ncbi:MAG: hypothetical protein NDF55_04525 [archaeon GB-1867-005]|nr:hypothetical protein [Candidatus Culexmicrobium cathedralense]
MNKGKWRIEYTSPSGEKISITLEGYFGPEKIKQLLDLVELFSSGYDNLSHTVTPIVTERVMTEKRRRSKALKEKLILLLNKRFNKTWFTSKQVAMAFFEEYGEVIPVNIITTYLARLHYSGLLDRQGSRARWRYRFSKELVSKVK